jgi:myosin heavy subunit
VVKLDKEKVWLRLTNEERNNYKGTSRPSLNVDSFETKVELTLDYSNNAAQGLPDMVDIDELNHATLMQNLQARYDRDEIYTYVGPIILAMNPFMNLNHKLYTDE